MNRHATGAQGPVQDGVPSPQLPADHVLSSGAVLFPGTFDQHGCPLVMFPVDGQDKLSSHVSKAEVVDFINYFLHLHNKRREKESLVSVVADLRPASPPTTRFIIDTLLLLELHKRTVHSLYIIQPKKKDSVKPLLKLQVPATRHTAALKKVLLKDISELSNYIDRSQLTPSLGGYFIYCHQSWVAFIKEIDAFVQAFVSVVQRLPSFISDLQALSRLPLPSTFTQLRHFCSTNEAKFQQLRRELGLDELLRHCESVMEKLRYPEKELCYQAMAGTALFSHTAFDMFHNHNRITAAVEKVELLWQQAFSQAHLQLHMFQLQEETLQIIEQIRTLQEKLQLYKIEVAKDVAQAEMLVSDFEASHYTPAMALVGCAEELIHTSAEILPLAGRDRDGWILDLERLKDKLHSDVHFTLQTLRAVSNYHHYFNKASRWYNLVLCDSFLQELLSGVNTDAAATQRQTKHREMIPAWRHRLSAFLKRNPPPDMEELVHLTHLSNTIPDESARLEGRQTSQRCMTLRKLLISSGPVAFDKLQLALLWQYELLHSSRVSPSSDNGATVGKDEDVQHSPSESNTTKCEGFKEVSHLQGTSPHQSAAVKLPSLSSFDSGFDGAGSSQPESRGGWREVEGPSRTAGSRFSMRPVMNHPQIHEEDISSVSNPDDQREEFDFGSVGNSSRASIQIIPKVSKDSLNFEIKVKRSAALPHNPWLSLPVDDLENSYTVTITPNPAPLPVHHGLSDPCSNTHCSNRPGDQPTKTEVLSSKRPRETQTSCWRGHSQSSWDDPDLSPICNRLSSTITDGREQTICTTEGIPSLLWDSYDLHDQDQDTTDSVINISQSDWDEKEHEELKEVEKLLGRTDEILEEEENVLAQEAVLDALLRAEDRHSHGPPWDSDDLRVMMSTSELSEAGVLCLEDDLVSTEYENTDESRLSFQSRPDLLKELRTVRVLDELIMEENLKIHELRRCEENPEREVTCSDPSDSKESPSVSKDREAFRFQLEKERTEVEKLEESLEKECEVMKHNDEAEKVKCSEKDEVIIEDEDRELSREQDECDGSQKTCSTSSMDKRDDPCETEIIQTELDPGITEGAAPHVCESQDRDLTSGTDPSAESSVSDLNQLAEELTVQPEGCIDGEESHEPGETATVCIPEASFTPEMRSEEEVFEPVKELFLCTEPVPRKALLLENNNKLVEPETLHSPDSLNPAPSSADPHPDFLQLDLQNESLPENVTVAISPNVTEQSNNNNNNHPETCELSSHHGCHRSTEAEPGASVEPARLPHTDVQAAVDIQPSSPTDVSQHEYSATPLPLDQPLEFDPGGRDALNEDMRVSVVSGSRPPGSPAQFNIITREVTDYKTAIVLDIGSGLVKAGFADQDDPNIIYPTIIGVPKYKEMMNSNVERETYVGHDAQRMRGVLTLKHPIKNGIIHNWDEMEKIWHHTFQQLGVDPEDHPVLLTEAAMNPLGNRQRMVEIMFEYFNVPFAYVAMQPVLALYAAGKTTGVVFYSGDGVSHSVPVFEGYSLPHALQRFPLAGVDVTMQLKKLLQEQGVNMRTTAEMELVRDMKEKCCCVALDYEAELTGGGSSCREMHYTMPDGQIVTLSTERFRAPEILFKPELIGQDHYGIHESIFKSVLRSDIDLRRYFLGNILLSGGNTLLPGLPQRLQAEIKGLVTSDVEKSVRVSSPEDRDFSVWRGGAVLANLLSSSSAWIEREEYEEFGPQIVFRKCF